MWKKMRHCPSCKSSRIEAFIETTPIRATIIHCRKCGYVNKRVMRL